VRYTRWRERLTGERQPIPAGYRWENLASPTTEGAELDRHYRETLRVLGTRGGMLGLIFEKAQNRIQDPAKLRRLITLKTRRMTRADLDEFVAPHSRERLPGRRNRARH